MPKELEAKLKAEAKKKGLGKKRAGAYVFGTMRKTGWKPGKPGKPVKSGNQKNGNNLKKLFGY